MIDPTTDIGKVRLRVGDVTDFPWFPDNVYQETINANSGNLVKAAADMANYILATLSFSTHSKLAQIETYDNQMFQQYKEFLLLTVTNPAFMTYAPVPHGGGIDGCPNPLIQFAKSWNAGYTAGTSECEMDSFASDVGDCSCPTLR